MPSGRAWRHATRAVGRLRDLAGDRTDRGERDEHREVTGRGDHRGEHANVTGRSDPQGDYRSDHEGATGRGDQTKATSRSDRRGGHRDDHEATRWGDRGDHRATRMRPLDRQRDQGHERAM